MIKTINIKLNEFPSTPNSLREKYCIVAEVAEDVQINLASLYHHYYLDNYGLVPPDPDPKNFEHLNFLTSDFDFRIAPESGIGISTAAKRNRSYELGQAFCRLFLSQHLGIVYFAHMDNVLNKETHRSFNGLSINRTKRGDVPDYLCARDTNNKIYIGEAKGRYEAIYFTTKEFASWREQFERIELRDRYSKLLSIKGYIVGTRFVTSKTPNLKTTLSAEDPNTPGDESINSVENDLHSLVKSQHYSNVARKLKFPFLAEALDDVDSSRKELAVDYSIWEIAVGPLKGTRFISNVYSRNLCGLIQNRDISNLLNFHESLAGMGSLDGTSFFGLHEDFFISMLWYVTEKEWFFKDVLEVDEFSSEHKDASLHKDGTLIMPFRMMKFIATETKIIS